MSVRRLLTPFLLVLLCACGGSGGNIGIGGGGGSGNAGVQGTWTGSFTVTGSPSSSVIYAAIAQGGFAFFYDQNGVIYVLPALDGNSPLTGALTAFAPAGITFSNGKSQEIFSLTATITSNSIKGSFSGNGETGTFTLTPYVPLPANNPTIVAGTWHGYYIGSGSPAALSITVLPSGAFIGPDSNGCTLKGNLTQLQTVGTAAPTPQNLFTVTVDSSGSSSNCLGSLSGLGFESKTDAGNLFGNTVGTYYYFGVSNATGAFIAELKVQ